MPKGRRHHIDYAIHTTWLVAADRRIQPVTSSQAIVDKSSLFNQAPLKGVRGTEVIGVHAIGWIKFFSSRQQVVDSKPSLRL